MRWRQSAPSYISMRCGPAVGAAFATSFAAFLASAVSFRRAAAARMAGVSLLTCLQPMRCCYSADPPSPSRECDSGCGLQRLAVAGPPAAVAGGACGRRSGTGGGAGGQNRVAGWPRAGGRMLFCGAMREVRGERADEGGGGEWRRVEDGGQRVAGRGGQRSDAEAHLVEVALVLHHDAALSIQLELLMTARKGSGLVTANAVEHTRQRQCLTLSLAAHAASSRAWRDAHDRNCQALRGARQALME